MIRFYAIMHDVQASGKIIYFYVCCLILASDGRQDVKNVSFTRKLSALYVSYPPQSPPAACYTF